jgi:hypothetical protein
MPQRFSQPEVKAFTSGRTIGKEQIKNGSSIRGAQRVMRRGAENAPNLAASYAASENGDPPKKGRSER